MEVSAEDQKFMKEGKKFWELTDASIDYIICNYFLKLRLEIELTIDWDSSRFSKYEICFLFWI